MSPDPSQPFSRRHGFSPTDREITIRDDAPEGLRATVLNSVNIDLKNLEAIICRVLNKLPSFDWSAEYITGNIMSDIRRCDWFKVYDIIEAIYGYLSERHPEAAQAYEDSINQYFRAAGIGWKLSQGIIEVRGSEAFEASLREAVSALDANALPTARREIEEALRDLSRRPDPDVTGAVQHAMAALECVARTISGDSHATLGALIERNPQMLPRPMDDIIRKLWGYSSEMARHLQEGRVIAFAEAVLVVHLSAAASTYLTTRE